MLKDKLLLLQETCGCIMLLGYNISKMGDYNFSKVGGLAKMEGLTQSNGLQPGCILWPKIINMGLEIQFDFNIYLFLPFNVKSAFWSKLGTLHPLVIYLKCDLCAFFSMTCNTIQVWRWKYYFNLSDKLRPTLVMKYLNLLLYSWMC